MKKLKGLLFEYEDGSTKSVSANNLAASVHFALAAAGFCSPPEQISAAGYYLVLEWKDGWKEVVGINQGAASLIRYYVNRRIEDQGRIALDVGEDYPQLRIIERRPMEISRLLIVGDAGVKSYELQSVIESYEGIFEDGGKKEYKKFDIANSYFQNEFSEGPENLASIKNDVANELKKKGLSAQDLLCLPPEQRIREYQQIGKAMGIMAVERQNDVYGFLETLLRKL
jgi:hypothetical protein